MNIAKLCIAVSALVAMGGACAFAYFQEPILSVGFAIEALAITFVATRHWSEL
jgi:hypothetical protein